MNKNKTHNKIQKQFKKRIFFLSLFLLFIFIFILKIELPFEKNWEYFFNNFLPILSIIIAIYSLALGKYIEEDLKGAYSLPKKIIKLENKNYENLIFLSTIIIPLICFDLNNIRYIIVLFISLAIIGYFTIKSDMYYANPTVALFGYKLYEAEIEGENNKIILITKDSLSINDHIKAIPIDQFIWKVIKNQNSKNIKGK